jgi:hypothetical protein
MNIKKPIKMRKVEKVPFWSRKTSNEKVGRENAMEA